MPGGAVVISQSCTQGMKENITEQCVQTQPIYCGANEVCPCQWVTHSTGASHVV